VVAGADVGPGMPGSAAAGDAAVERMTTGNVPARGVGAGRPAYAEAFVAHGIPEGETTHLSVVDREGNAVALTTTLSPYFGSGAWVDGFFLNSSAVDLSRADPNAPARSDGRARRSPTEPTR